MSNSAPDAVCDRCHCPAIQVAGRWQHAELADAVFCALVMRGMTIETETTE